MNNGKLKYKYRNFSKSIIPFVGNFSLSKNEPILNIDWTIPSRFIQFYIEFNSVFNTIGTSFSIPPIAVWIGFENSVLRKLLNKIFGDAGKVISFRIFDGKIFWELFNDATTWKHNIKVVNYVKFLRRK